MSSDDAVTPPAAVAMAEKESPGVDVATGVDKAMDDFSQRLRSLSPYGDDELRAGDGSARPAGDALPPPLPDDGPTPMDELMREAFGPPDGEEGGDDRAARGLKKVAELEDAAAAPPRWLHEFAPEPPEEATAPPLCWRCGANGPRHTCAQCGVAAYCSRECQKADWGKRGAFGGHKPACAEYKRLGRPPRVPGEDRRPLLERLLAQLRLYMWPFAVRQIEERGRGFVFLQSEVSLATLGLPAPRSPCGRLLEHRRSLILHHVTLAEFDGEICDAFPGLGGARPALAAALEGDGGRAGAGEAIVLVRLACGLVAVVVTPILLDPGVLRRMGEEYAGKDCIQIDVDEVAGTEQGG